MKIKIWNRKGNEHAIVDIDTSVQVLDLKKAIYAVNRRIGVRRMYIHVDVDGKKIALDDLTLLSEYPIGEAGLVIKDLGPQLNFRTVFLWEYIGPFVLYPVFAYLLMMKQPLNMTQMVAVVLWSLHYAKRILETIFVHEFGTLTMPFKNVVKNCAYYWGAACLCGWFVFRTGFTEPDPIFLYIGAPGMVLMALGNLKCHLYLKKLRGKSSNKFLLPKGFLFEYVTVPNYFFEIMTWVMYNVFTQTIGGIIFNILGCLQMMQWAVQRHKKYMSDFPEYKSLGRKRLFPFIW